MVMLNITITPEWLRKTRALKDNRVSIIIIIQVYYTEKWPADGRTI